MKKWIAACVVCLVLGGIVGGMVQQRVMRQRQHVLAVMWLSQFHLQSLQNAVTSGDCAAATQSATRLQTLASEIALALPLADAQDATFHRYIEQLKTSAIPATVASGQCAYDAALLKRMRDACTDCHRDYR